MADGQSEVRLIITGENQSALESIDAVSKSVAGISESIAQMATRFAEAGTSISEFGRGVGEAADSLSRISGAFTRFGKNVGDQSKAVTEATDTIVTDLQRIPTVADEVARTAAQSMQELATAEREVSSASYAMTDRINAEANAMRAQAEATKASTSTTRQGAHDMMLAVIAMQMIGTSITGVGLLGAKMFVGATKSAMDFQAMMSRVGAALRTTGGDTAQNISNLSALAMQLDQTSLYSMNEIGDMMQALAKQGLSYQDIYKGAASATITLAQATDSSLTDTGTVVTDVMHEFSLKGSQLTPVVNAISGALHQANISMTDFYNSMKMAGPMASNLGMSVTDTATAVGLLAQHGIKGSQAGTTLRRMFLNLQPHTKAATAEFKALNLMTANGTSLFYDASGKVKSMGDVLNILHSHLAGLDPVQKQQALNTMFGTYALSGMTVMASETTTQWDALQKSMANTSAAEVAAQKMNNLKGHLKEFTSTIQTIGTSMATFMMPALDKIVQGMQRLAGGFKDLSPWMQHAIFIIIGVGSALAILVGTLITAAATLTFIQPGFAMMTEFFNGSKLVTGIRNVASAMGLMSAAEDVEAASMAAALAPIALIVVALAVVGVAVYEVIKHWKAVSAVTEQVWSHIQAVITVVWQFLKPYIMSAVQAVSAFWQQVWPQMQQVFTVVWNVIKGIAMTLAIPMFTLIRVALGAFQGSWKSIWDIIKAALKLVWDIMVADVKIAWELFSGVIKIGLDLLTMHWGKAWTDLKTMLNNIWNDLKNLSSKALSDLYNIVVNAVKGIVGGVVGAFQGLISAAKSVWSTITGIFSGHISGPTVSAPTVSGSSNTSTMPRIPHFAAGGIVKAPTIALIGEAGPEMVVPLNGINQSSSNYSIGLRGNPGVGNNVTIGTVVVQTNASDAQGIAKAIKTQLGYALR